MLDDQTEKRFSEFDHCLASLEKGVNDIRSQGEATHQLLNDLLNRLSLDPTSLPPSTTTTTRPSPLPCLPPFLHITPPVEHSELRKSAVKPSVPTDFDGEHSKGKAFLTSCRTYIRLVSDLKDDTTRIFWAMSYMKSGHTGSWAAREFEHKAKHGALHFYDWDEFEAEFRKAFLPLNVEAAAVNTLETTSYFQGKHSVDEYLDQFQDLVHDSGYKDPKTVVVKFRHGLDCRISNALAGMTTGQPSDTDPEAWFHLATQMDQNSATDKAFHTSLSPLPLSASPSVLPSWSSSFLPSRAPPPVSYAHITPSAGNPVPMEIDAARRNKAIAASSCHHCGGPDHWAKDCPVQFDIHFLSVEELQVILDDKLDEELEDNDHEDTTEPQSDPEAIQHFNIRTLEGNSHRFPPPLPSTSPETQMSS